MLFVSMSAIVHELIGLRIDKNLQGILLSFLHMMALFLYNGNLYFRSISATPIRIDTFHHGMKVFILLNFILKCSDPSC